ncbi:hypothetical protein IFM89_029816 [Coptis chinensis]|uniref:NADH-quinone oxidoreductase subunit D domain-containing protein n=1 Tax=Coptis chinensis TaxID=261450 RepID=A0A835HQK5_9MAGN|nr:hypothetical protein IFM89_029816 [Coptis chinensis]
MPAGMIGRTRLVIGKEGAGYVIEREGESPGSRDACRFHTTGGVAQDLPLGLCRDIDSSTQQFASRDRRIEEISTATVIRKQRLVDIGNAVHARQAKDWGFSGVMLRGRAT